MALPNSGPISLSAIQTEFGGTNPISLSEYYAGGSNVSGGTSGVNGAVPSSGTIGMNIFYGTASGPAARGLYFHGGGPSPNIQTILIATTGNSVSWGSNYVDIQGAGDGGALSNTTRWLSTWNAVIGYGNFAATGTGLFFGNFTNDKHDEIGGHANTTRGIWFGGNDGDDSTMLDIDYSTLATLGNAASFGQYVNGAYWTAGAGNSTRGVFALYFGMPAQYVTIATLGNSSTFGNVTAERSGGAAGCSTTRGVWANGTSGNPVTGRTLDYVTIATLGNFTSFGQSSYNRYATGGSCSATRATFAGGTSGDNPYPALAQIEYVTITTTGNTSAFGNLNAATGLHDGTSNNHGGIAA